MTAGGDPQAVADPGRDGVLRARPEAGRTFRGRSAESVAGSARADSPTRCAARTRLYRDGELVTEGLPVSQISEVLDSDGAVVWLDLHDPDLTDLALITEVFGLHPLALEDAVYEHQRPKLDRYRSHLFLTAYAVALDPNSREVATSELAAFVTPHALITVRKDDGFDLQALLDRWDSDTELATHGVGYLLYGLLDVVIDGHFATVRQIDEAIEVLEDELFEDAAGSSNDRTFQQRSFALRKSLVLTRRVVLPMREVVNTLLRRDLQAVPEAMAPYYQDIYDHALRAAEWTESLRDLVSSILETRMTIQSNRLNEIMKKLTAWAAIIAVPTAVTGFYGQNVPYPGSQHISGLISSAVIILAIASLLYTTFKRKNWL